VRAKRFANYLVVLVATGLVTTGFAACGEAYYARSFEENRIRRVAEDANEAHQEVKRVEILLARENEYLEGVVSQLSYLATKAKREATQSHLQMQKLKVKSLTPPPSLSVNTK